MKLLLITLAVFTGTAIAALIIKSPIVGCVLFSVLAIKFIVLKVLINRIPVNTHK